MKTVGKKEKKTSPEQVKSKAKPTPKLVQGLTFKSMFVKKNKIERK
jgi:hypothetical protein